MYMDGKGVVEWKKKEKEKKESRRKERKKKNVQEL